MPKRTQNQAALKRATATKPPVLMERTQPVIDRISAALGEPVFTYWNSSKGSICQNDVVGLYALAKALEALDKPIFAVGHMVSGHTLKHLAGAAAGFCILRMLQKRRTIAPIFIRWV